MKNSIYLLLATAIGFVSCEKAPDYDELSSDLVVSTNFDKTATFNYKTYYIGDTIINLGGTGADTIITGDKANQLINVVKSNMSARGYTLVPRKSKPDVGLRMGVVEVVNVDVYAGWWSGYDGWYPYWWGGYYPYYYPWTTVYAYDTGTIILDMYDLKNAAANGQYRVIWNSTSFGAVGSDAGANMSRGINSINQAFIQSPYLKVN